MKSGITFAISFMAILLAHGAAQAAQTIDPPLTGVTLTAEQSVHKAKSPGAVKFTLTNQSSQTLHIDHIAPYEVLKGNKSFYAPLTILVAPSPLNPGQSLSWSWDKKSSNGKWAPPGTYTIKVGPIFTPVATSQNYRSIDIALTPTGTLGGSSMFPLGVSNEWSFQPNTSANSTLSKVTTKKGQWYMVQGLLGANRWVRMHSISNTLHTAPKPSTAIQTLFRFGLAQGSSYSTNLAGMWKMTVGSTNETVVTPAGTFNNCYRLDVEYLPTALVSKGYKSFYFAPGVGLVQYVMFGTDEVTIWWNEVTIWSLHHAKVRAFNGMLYRIGQK